MTLKERYAGVIAWFEEHMPVAESELAYGSPYELLVAVILSAQCTDKRVNMTTPALFEAFPTPQAMAAATPRADLSLHQEHLLSQQQGEKPGGHGPHALRGVRRRSTERSEGAATSARRGTQDGQCRGRRDLAEGGDARRYPRISGFEPYRTHEPVENAPCRPS